MILPREWDHEREYDKARWQARSREITRKWQAEYDELTRTQAKENRRYLLITIFIAALCTASFILAMGALTQAS